MFKKNKSIYIIILIFQSFLFNNKLIAQADRTIQDVNSQKTNLVSSSLTTNSTPCRIRIARWAKYTIGDTWFADFNSQLTSAKNYGSNGTYNKILGFTFTDISINYNNYTAQQLKDSFDIINTGYKEMTTAQALKLKEYSELGGVVIVNCDMKMGSEIFKTFGGKGNIGIGGLSALTNNNTILNGVFGTGVNKNILGAESIGRFTNAQLPTNATVLVNETTGEPAIFLTGSENRVLFIWDEGIFRNISVSGTIIDTSQEIVLHNVMTYMIEKVYSVIPTVSLNIPSPICSGMDTTLTAVPGTTGNYIYDWTVPNGAILPGNVASFITKIPGYYSVIITNTATGCTSSSASSLLSIYPLPTARLFATTATETCKDEEELSITFIGNGGTTPYTFTYSINKTTIKSITSPPGSNTATLVVPTNSAGTFKYELISVKDSNSRCN